MKTTQPWVFSSLYCGVVLQTSTDCLKAVSSVWPGVGSRFTVSGACSLYFYDCIRTFFHYRHFWENWFWQASIQGSLWGFTSTGFERGTYLFENWNKATLPPFFRKKNAHLQNFVFQRDLNLPHNVPINSHLACLQGHLVYFLLKVFVWLCKHAK